MNWLLYWELQIPAVFVSQMSFSGPLDVKVEMSFFFLSGSGTFVLVSRASTQCFSFFLLSENHNMSSPWLVLRCSAGDGSVWDPIPVSTDSFIVGRSETAAVQIRHPLASRLHFSVARITAPADAAAPKAVLTDTSRRGTLIRSAATGAVTVLLRSSLEVFSGDAVYFPERLASYANPSGDFATSPGTMKVSGLIRPLIVFLIKNHRF
jgi:hypothetical protein